MFNDTDSSNGLQGQDDGNTTVKTERDETFAKVEIGILATIFCLAIISNGLVLSMLLFRSKKLSRMNLMIVHLCVADLFVALCNVLPQLIWDITYRFYGGDFLCRTVKYLQVIGMYASSYVIVSTAADRYLAICHPLTTHTWTTKKSHALVGVAWLLSFLFAMPQVFLFGYRRVGPDKDAYDCWADFQPEWTLQLYVSWTAIAIYFVPTLILISAYGVICYAVWLSMSCQESTRRQSHAQSMQQRKNRKHSNSSSHSHSTTAAGGGATANNRSSCGEQSALVANGFTANLNSSSAPRAHVRGMPKAKLKTVKLTLTVVFSYLICWGPFFVCQLWAAWDINAPFTGKAFTVLLLLASLNSCTNPWIYLAFSNNFVRKVSNCFRRGKFKDRSASYDMSSRTPRLSSATDTTRLDSHYYHSLAEHKRRTSSKAYV